MTAYVFQRGLNRHGTLAYQVLRHGVESLILLEEPCATTAPCLLAKVALEDAGFAVSADDADAFAATFLAGLHDGLACTASVALGVVEGWIGKRRAVA